VPKKKWLTSQQDVIESHKQNSVNVFKASLWRRLIGKALQAGRLGGRLASDWYGVRLTTMASGSRRFGVRFVEIEQGGRHTGMATVGKRGRGRKDGESAGARESIACAGD